MLKANEYTFSENEKSKFITAKKRVFTCPGNHVFEFSVKGNFERIIIYCKTCDKGYQLTRAEVEKL